VRKASVGAGASAGGTISQQDAVHPWLAADAHGNRQVYRKMFWSHSVTNRFKSVLRYICLPHNNKNNQGKLPFKNDAIKNNSKITKGKSAKKLANKNEFTVQIFLDN
jgi:hypothetical protein